MAYRVECGEVVETAAGLNVTGALVTIKFHGGANAPVYDSENGGSLLTQPISTVNGKIGGDAPSGAWVAEGDYDIVVAGGAPDGSDLTFFWPARRSTQFVTTLPAGVGTSAPEDNELAIELYDGTNGGAWLRRYRGAVSAWDMIGGPPPAGTSLPSSPRARQEFYLTGGTPAVRHMRYNGASWDFVGASPMSPVTNSPVSVLEPGQATQNRAGRNLTVADFTTLLSLSTPIGLFPLNATTNLGTGGALTNKGTVTFGTGIMGTTSAAQFTGSTAQVLYITDTGAADPFRIKTGSWGAWINTPKRGANQAIMGKYDDVIVARRGWVVSINASNVASATVAVDGTVTGLTTVTGTTDIADGRWHHVAVTVDGGKIRLYIDGVLENSATFGSAIFGTPAAFNIGGYGAETAVVTVTPFFGRVDEAFVTSDVLSDDQVRMLYAAAVPHGYTSTPTRVSGNVRRRLRGGLFAATDFPAAPTRLYNLSNNSLGGILADIGTSGTALTASNSFAVSGPDGTLGGALSYLGATYNNSATDAGLPSGLSSRSYGVWFKSAASPGASQGLLTWGTAGTADAGLRIFVTGFAIQSTNAADSMVGPTVNDGLWHFAVSVEDNAAVDGVKRKLYLDGKVVAGSTVLNSITLAGAARFQLGALPDGTAPFTGQLARAFVYAGALTPEQVSALYNKGSQALGPAPFDATSIVKGMDATNLYTIMDTVGSQNLVDLSVAS